MSQKATWGVHIWCASTHFERYRVHITEAHIYTSDNGFLGWRYDITHVSSFVISLSWVQNRLWCRLWYKANLKLDNRWRLIALHVCSEFCPSFWSRGEQIPLDFFSGLYGSSLNQMTFGRMCAPSKNWAAWLGRWLQQQAHVTDLVATSSSQGSSIVSQG